MPTQERFKRWLPKSVLRRSARAYLLQHALRDHGGKSDKPHVENAVAGFANLPPGHPLRREQ